MSISTASTESSDVLGRSRAIYEPHQQEEIISYLILGEKQALLFDTGMGISDMKKVVEGLTSLPVSVMNSHTHNDHVSDNWRFSKIYGVDTAFTRQSANGSVADAQEEIGPGMVCGDLPPGFDARSYAVSITTICDHQRVGEICAVFATASCCRVRRILRDMLVGPTIS